MRFFGNGVSECFRHNDFLQLLILRRRIARRGVDGGDNFLFIPFIEFRLRDNLDLCLHIVMP